MTIWSTVDGVFPLLKKKTWHNSCPTVKLFRASVSTLKLAYRDITAVSRRYLSN